jgi:3-oxoacyl-[acyl-carrier-protein] synthase II
MTRSARSVVVTGIGPVSAIGCDRNAFWDALLAGRSGVGPITLCDAAALPSRIAAQVPGFALERYLENGAALARHTPRTNQFALAAAVLALHDAEIDLDAHDPDRLGLQVGTGLGNLGEVMRIAQAWRDGTPMPPHAAFVSVFQSAACVLSTTFNIRGPVLTTSTGCNSGIDALGQALRQIQSGAVDTMLVVGADCEVYPEAIAALSAANSLCTRFHDEPVRASRPFDVERDGNVIGEGAAALVLEAEPLALARRARTYARVAGYSICGAGAERHSGQDPHAIDLRPAVRALRGALREATWRERDVDVVSANGSSSKIYDIVEARALREVFASRDGMVPVHSIKSMLGQHGAGSSALQCVAACLAIRRGAIPPTINHEHPDPSCQGLDVVTTARPAAVQRVLVHSIGLGGFYYSAAAFAALSGDKVSMTTTGDLTTVWSKAHSARFPPSPEFQRPLAPWRPRREWDGTSGDQVQM